MNTRAPDGANKLDQGAVHYLMEEKDKEEKEEVISDARMSCLKCLPEQKTFHNFICWVKWSANRLLKWTEGELFNKFQIQFSIFPNDIVNKKFWAANYSYTDIDPIVDF